MSESVCDHEAAPLHVVVCSLAHVDVAIDYAHASLLLWDVSALLVRAGECNFAGRYADVLSWRDVRIGLVYDLQRQFVACLALRGFWFVGLVLIDRV